MVVANDLLYFSGDFSDHFFYAAFGEGI